MIVINGNTVHNGDIIGDMVISDGEVFVGGKKLTGEGFKETKVFNITVTGNVDKLKFEKASGSVTVQGDCDSVNTMSGDVSVAGDIKGSAKTMSGNIDVDGSIEGSVKTMSGDIKHRTPK
jgi:DUF4097 and DUF4098 domain-containing protein YvlB